MAGRLGTYGLFALAIKRMVCVWDGYGRSVTLGYGLPASHLVCVVGVSEQLCIVVCAGKLRVGAGWGGRVSGLSMPAATVYHQYKHSYIYTVHAFIHIQMRQRIVVVLVSRARVGASRHQRRDQIRAHARILRAHLQQQSELVVA